MADDAAAADLIEDEVADDAAARDGEGPVEDEVEDEVANDAAAEDSDPVEDEIGDEDVIDQICVLTLMCV